MTKKAKPKPISREHEGVEWTYYISRDSLAGVLSAKCSLWWQKPARIAKGRSVLWGDKSKPGYLGEYAPAVLAPRFRTYPETDLELIKIETRPTAAEYEESKKQWGAGS